tara:strand:- start:6405 stop:6773 length:369 start_codon:yes stop_codon:yes gene_type:complete
MAFTTNGKSIKDIMDAYNAGEVDFETVYSEFETRRDREGKSEGWVARYTRAIDALDNGVDGSEVVAMAFAKADKPKAKAKVKAKAKGKSMDTKIVEVANNPLSKLSKAQVAQVMAYIEFVSK